jgi:hypothetical protein
MLTHVHKVGNTCWCWHICEDDGVWGVERGLGSLAGFRRFEEMKRLFSIAPKAGRSGEVARVFLDEKHSTDAGLEGDRRCPQRLSAYPRCRSVQEEATDVAWLSDWCWTSASVGSSISSFTELGATYVGRHLLATQRTRLSGWRRLWTLSGPRLSRWARVRCVCVNASVVLSWWPLKFSVHWRSTTLIWSGTCGSDPLWVA